MRAPIGLPGRAPLQQLPDELPAYEPVGTGADDVLGYLAWGATAAGVLGIIIIGTQLALQLRRGEMGEGASYFRGGFIVVGACVLATSAGPIVEFLGPFDLR